MKLPFTFATRFLFRLFVPGLLLALACLPMTEAVASTLTAATDQGLHLLLSAVVLGWFVTMLDMPIYMLFEGRRFWPHWLWRLALEGETRRLGRIRQRRCQAEQAGDPRRVAELDLEEALFPLSADGRPEAVYPTRLGNLVTEFEQYPDRKYDIDGVFYWYRIWLNLDKDLRAELDEQQATVDGLLYVSFVLYLSGLVFIAYATLTGLFGLGFYDGMSGWRLLGLALLAVALGYIVYRVSLPAHAQYGNFFKATFDCFYSRFDPKPVLAIIADATGERLLANERGTAAYRIAWRYLRWHEFRPRGSDANVNFETARAAVTAARQDKPAPPG